MAIDKLSPGYCDTCGNRLDEGECSICTHRNKFFPGWTYNGVNLWPVSSAPYLLKYVKETKDPLELQRRIVENQARVLEIMKFEEKMSKAEAVHVLSDELKEHVTKHKGCIATAKDIQIPISGTTYTPIAHVRDMTGPSASPALGWRQHADNCAMMTGGLCNCDASQILDDVARRIEKGRHL